jgi:hypothetical protein
MPAKIGETIGKPYDLSNVDEIIGCNLACLKIKRVILIFT